MQLSNSCLPCLFGSLLTLHYFMAWIKCSAKRETPKFGLSCPKKVARGWNRWRQRSCTGKDNEVGTCTQQEFRNDLRETMWQSGNLIGQGAQQLLAYEKNTIFCCSYSSVAISTPSWMWWGTEVEVDDFQVSFPGMVLDASHIAFVQGCDWTRSSS